MPRPVAILKIIREEHSQPFAVQVDVVGSGFFIAPSVVVTCAHTVASAFGMGRPSSALCLVATLDGIAYGFSNRDVITDEARDLALIRLKHEVPDTDIFELATAQPQRDQECVLRGFAPPAGAVFGCAGRGLNFGKRWHIDISSAAAEFANSVIQVRQGFQADGPMVLPDAIVVCCEGQTKQGLSGAPLIDMQTGRVFGVGAMGPRQPLWPQEAAEERGLSNWTVSIAAEHVASLLEQHYP